MKNQAKTTHFYEDFNRFMDNEMKEDEQQKFVHSIDNLVEFTNMVKNESSFRSNLKASFSKKSQATPQLIERIKSNVAFY